MLQAHLLSAVHVSPQSVPRQVLECLKAAVCTDPSIEDPVVRFDEFMCFAHYFGPCDAALPARLVELLRAPWFHGPISEKQATARLNGEPGSFLVRYSSQRDGNMTVQNTVAKYQVHRVPGGWEISSRVYPSLGELLAANRDSIGTKSPGSQYTCIFEEKKEYYKTLTPQE